MTFIPKTPRRAIGLFDWTGKDDELKSMWAAGMTGQKIGDHFGVTRNSVIGRLRRIEDQVRHKPSREFPIEREIAWTPERLEFLIENAKTMTVLELSSHLKLPTTKIYDRGRKMGLTPFMAMTVKVEKPKRSFSQVPKKVTQ